MLPDDLIQIAGEPNTALRGSVEQQLQALQQLCQALTSKRPCIEGLGPISRRLHKEV